MNTMKMGMICAFLMLISCPALPELIWQAEYTNHVHGEAVPFSATLTDDQFTSSSAPTVKLTTYEYTPGEIGLSISNETAQAKNIRLDAGLTEEHKLIVVSFDWVSGSPGTVGLTANAMSPTGTRPHGALTPVPLAGANAPARYTLVINRTGGDLTLGNGEVLANNSVANYLKMGSGYSNYSSQALTADVAGFMLTASAVIGINVVDNIGLWATTDGSVDTVDGVNVMQLDFGVRPTGMPRIPGVILLR